MFRKASKVPFVSSHRNMSFIIGSVSGSSSKGGKLASGIGVLAEVFKDGWPLIQLENGSVSSENSYILDVELGLTFQQLVAAVLDPSSGFVHPNSTRNQSMQSSECAVGVPHERRCNLSSFSNG